MQKRFDLFGAAVNGVLVAVVCLAFLFFVHPIVVSFVHSALVGAVSARADQFIEHYAEIGSDGSQAQDAVEMLCRSDYDIVVITAADNAYPASTSGELAARYDNVAHLDVGSDKWAALLADAWLPNATGMQMLYRDVEFQLGGEYATVGGRAVSGDGSVFRLWMRLRFDGNLGWGHGDPQKWCVLQAKFTPVDETASR